MALLMNMANVSATSRVMLIDGARGLVAGALLERSTAYVLKVEFATSGLKVSSDILNQYNFGCGTLRRLGHIHADILADASENTVEKSANHMMNK
jgi:2-C-methyl-D-erythritol 4-phosphate cytidylyltransferase